MAYNPGITNRSGEILAQGIASAAQTRMQGYQNVANSLLKGFTDLSKKQQEEELKRNEALAKFQSDPDLLAKLSEKGNEDLKARYDRLKAPVEGFWTKFAGRNDLKDSDLLSKFAMGTQEATGRATAKTMLNFAIDEAKQKKDAADRVASEYANLETWRAGLDKPYQAGVKRLSEYNDFKNADENRPKLEQVNLRNQFISDTPTIAIGYKNSAPPALGRFDQIPHYSRPDTVPTYNKLGPRSPVPAYPKLGHRDRLYGTPEEINQMVYAYTPGSNSVQQRIRSYGDTITPELMRGENTTEAARDRATYQAEVAKAKAMNTEQRRMETAVRNKQLDANAAEQLSFSRSAEDRAARGEERTIANAAKQPIGTVIKVLAGAREQERQKIMDAEINANPQFLALLRKLVEQFYVVSKEDRAAMNRYIDSFELSQEAKQAVKDQLRY